MPMQNEIEIFLRIILSCLLGGLIGIERERGLRPAGFRTHILVCAGAALFTVVSMYGFANQDHITRDPARVAAQIVSGIGFLGAGTILHEGFSVKGLTTAASLWIVAGIGMACGTGMMSLAIFSTSTVLLVLVGFRKLESKYSFFHTYDKSVMQIIFNEKETSVQDFVHFLEDLGVVVKSISLQSSNEENQVLLELKIGVSKGNVNNILSDINNHKAVSKVVRIC